MKIRNFTAHPLCFYREEDAYFVSEIRKYVAKPNTEPYLIVPSEGMLSIRTENSRNEAYPDSPVPIWSTLVVRMDKLPLIDEHNEILVVSAMFANARRMCGTDTIHIPLYTVKDTVYNDNGAPIGCLGLIR